MLCKHDVQYIIKCLDNKLSILNKAFEVQCFFTFTGSNTRDESNEFEFKTDLSANANNSAFASFIISSLVHYLVIDECFKSMNAVEFIIQPRIGIYIIYCDSLKVQFKKPIFLSYHWHSRSSNLDLVKFLEY